MSRAMKILAVVAAIAVLALLVAEFRWVVVHLSQATGTSNSSSRAYDFWSGFGSDLGEATIVVGIVAAWRHHSCHVAGCPRLGKPVEGTPYLACPKHHPAHQGHKRGVSMDEIHRHFASRRR